ncbi:ArsA family ATPase [Zhihengliuella halotolerans]|uniref:Arsenite efflux ATP-binding protein ArsA n=1 Tax=Zhihengliuella halotolerans TaxID=370736 RepID=A0A4Q8AIM5_9MICC|nr:ArsA family ATPase [Zhihengliuella halotolerans]RZU63609.1 arsenite efflux ATP-binding protein ArsA [Zhihengliuella halotolerans]
MPADLTALAAGARVVFFSGKGGVGKTTLAAATAVAEADAGRRVLLVSTDPAHNLGHLFGARLTDAPTALIQHDDGACGAGRLDALELDPAAATEKHLREVGATIRALMPEHLHREVDKYLRLASEAPGTHEASVLERIAELTEQVAGEADPAGRQSTASAQPEVGYDVVIFDTAPSGHTARLMELPEMMTAWTDGLLKRREASEKFGAALVGLGGKSGAAETRDARIRSVLTRRRTRFAKLRELLSDPARCAFVLVLAAERLPVAETIEFAGQLRAQGIGVRSLVVNKRSPADAGEFLARRRAQEKPFVADLASALPGVPVLNLRLAAEEIRGLDGLRSVPGLAEGPGAG